MKTPTKREEPAKQPPSGPERGAPTTYAVRKDLAVRELLKPTNAESEESQEHGYGHGV